MISEETIERYLSLYAGPISDAGGVWIPGFHRYIGDFHATAAGAAYILEGRCVSKATDAGHQRQAELLESVPKGAFVLITSDGDYSTAHFGDITYLCLNHTTGIAVQGAIRDKRLINEACGAVGPPVWYNCVIPIDACGKWEIVDAPESIVVNERLVHRDDLLFADPDGLIVVNWAIVDRVLEKAESIAKREDQLRESLRDYKVTPTELFRKFGVW